MMPGPTSVIIDTDIGTDIDDAFALATALVSPEIRLLGITTTSGNVHLRARLAERLASVAGRTDVPIAVGIATPGPFDPAGRPITYTQAPWADASPLPERAWPPAIPFALDQIRRHPHEITLLCIGPLTNVAALIERDAHAFRQLDRLVVMGGSIHVGFADGDDAPQPPAVAEYNIVQDVRAAQTVFASGVPLELLPLDATQVKLDRAHRQRLFAGDAPLAGALASLYEQWSGSNPWGDTPTLYDVVALARIIDPALCPMQPMHVAVDDDGYTRVLSEPPNAAVCLNVREDAIRERMMQCLERFR